MRLRHKEHKCCNITFIPMPPPSWRIEVKQTTIDGPYAWCASVFAPGKDGYTARYWSHTREGVLAQAEAAVERLKFEAHARLTPPEVLHR